MGNQGTATEQWPGGKAAPRAGCYEYKNVRFKLARSTSGWSFQPFGREAREFESWEAAVAALEEGCAAIARHRAERRNR